MISLAVLLLVRQQYGSFAIAGLAIGGVSSGIAAAAPIQGSLVDQYGSRHMLPAAALGQGMTCGALAAAARLNAPVPAMLTLAILAGVFVPPISATMRSAWMSVIDDGPVRDAAFALDAMMTQVVFALGPLITAATVEVASPAAAVVLSGLITIAGTLVFVGAAPITATRQRALTQALAPSQAVRRIRWMAALSSRGLRGVLLTIFIAGSAGGSVEVGLPALAAHLGSRAVSGILLGLWAFGAVVGGWYYGRRAWQGTIEMRYRVAAAAVGLLSLPLIGARSVVVAATLSFVAGLPWASLYACQYGMVGQRAPNHAVTEAFTWSVAAIVGGTAIGSAVGGALVSSVGVWSCFVLTAVASGASIVSQAMVRIMDSRV